MEWRKLIVRDHLWNNRSWEDDTSVRHLIEHPGCGVQGKVSVMLKSGILYIVFGTENFGHHHLLNTYNLFWEEADWKGGAFFILDKEMAPFINGQSEALKGGLTPEIQEIVRQELNKLVGQYSDC